MEVEALFEAAVRDMATVEDLEDDVATCDFIINSDDRLFCIVNIRDHAELLYSDGVLSSSRKIVYAPMFSTVDDAWKFIDAVGRDLLRLNGDIDGVQVITLVDAAKVRAARNVKLIDSAGVF